jgi:hypothetical protein
MVRRISSSEEYEIIRKWRRLYREVFLNVYFPPTALNAFSKEGPDCRNM